MSRQLPALADRDLRWFPVTDAAVLELPATTSLLLIAAISQCVMLIGNDIHYYMYIAIL